MRLIGSLILALVATFLWSCGTTGLTGSGSKENKNEAPLVYYAAEEGLKLYPEPDFSKEPIAELPLNEKVLRYRNEKAFGYVKVERTGQMGWVENARLKWRIEKQEIEPKTAAPEQQQEAPLDQPSPQPPEDQKKAGGAPFPKEAEAATPPETSDQSESKKKPDASVLDSY